MKPPTKRRKINTVTVEEVKFDDSARADYLTGFHKRKVARIKHAQEQAAKKEKEEARRDREDVSCVIYFLWLYCSINWASV
ncbi:hypothetical protein EJ08DRAFT_388157 [Tothia fuscella]|uniref:Ribosomal RNA-processing protein 17 n=1 Tax=Tothia fuscella TaxID=1048955 RepID=A0A9P4P1E2_9PEZI|nr:hypothetical protein EJ08DRAFT_388157 [Tothia fuscella]